MGWDSTREDLEPLLTREWLVTNGLGGYASGTVSGAPTRRYHGFLVAALEVPHGRTMVLGHIGESVVLPDGQTVELASQERVGGQLLLRAAAFLHEFRVEQGLPVWCWRVGDCLIERQLVLPAQQNTVHIHWRLVSGPGPIKLLLRPAVDFRNHDASVSTPQCGPHTLTHVDGRYELRCSNPDLPPLRLRLHGRKPAFTVEAQSLREVMYRVEQSRGYDYEGDIWSPGEFRAELAADSPVVLVASTEPWLVVDAIEPKDVLALELERRAHLLSAAHPSARDGIGAELVLAADQFCVDPSRIRSRDAARSHAVGHEPRSIIAGYHWFTDWGRDAMISLEGLCLCTGRHNEAADLLRTFGEYMRDGLIPNLFPEGGNDGLYHTADATLWFFHAIHRHLEHTGDRTLLADLLPVLREIIACHLRGTRFGIHVDPRDGLLSQGVPGYQLTWMDAKVADWVVTPRRGKAAEINALWYNALRLMESWLDAADEQEAARDIQAHADRCRASFNRRFWNEAEGFLFDVVDGEDGTDDPACRPNQLLAFSLGHQVLDQAHWPSVLQVVQERLLTPVGLRSLAPGHADYKPRYFGDLRARDAAYHQGTVWAWLIGPFIDAWLRVHPGELSTARAFLEGFWPHLGEACIGSISEVFDAEPPFTPRGCIAQAWSVAEVLRCWVKTAEVLPVEEP